ncbi:AraC family transcriptional regulator [Roseomonas sp. 18066]|uniref:helix-turn-helix transcriptional regulator n=1 Tax=Roseomonas sp. 18066 TaxID=2681412 RepID=UPI00135BCEEB|nr:AraC family transcriptional regulator [Roseomonas sp. 18066]
MADPLAEVVGLLQPGAGFSKLVEGAGAWRVSRSEAGRPFYCALLEGATRLTIPGLPPLLLEAGDFVLIPAAHDFAMDSLAAGPGAGPAVADSLPVELRPGVYRIGDAEGPASLRSMVGYCSFGSGDTALLLSLLPKLVHVRGVGRLLTLVQLVDDESRAARPGREVVLQRLLEVLLIEALRATAGPAAPSGLLRGLADDRVAVALRQMHGSPTAAWTVPQLARLAALSRSAFFDRFRRVVGVTPMDYLLHWRMALAKDLLRRGAAGIAETASRVGYSSASTFSTAFARHVGLPPGAYARRQAAE